MKEFEIRSTHLQAENQKLVGYVVEWNSRSEPLFDFVMVSFPATAQRPVIVTKKEMIMKKLFTPEFKQKCLNLLLNERHTTIEVSKMMNVSVSALQRWKVQYHKEKQGITPKQPAITAEQREIQRLRAEVEQLKEDNALLKKVSAFFLDRKSNGTV